VCLEDIDECAANNGLGPCGVNAVNCTEQIGSYQCACKSGFAFNGVTCSGQLTLLAFWLPASNDDGTFFLSSTTQSHCDNFEVH